MKQSMLRHWKLAPRLWVKLYRDIIGTDWDEKFLVSPLFMQRLGDSHNFGKFVTDNQENLIWKPRTLYWEWLFLSSDSFFRNWLDRASVEALNVSVFSLFPILRFKMLTDAGFQGHVEKCEIVNIEQDQIEDIQLSYKMGVTIGMLSWFGILDLHRDNIGFGIDIRNGNKLFFPYDIETIFHEIIIPSETHLFSSRKTTYEKCGLHFYSKLLSNSHQTVNHVSEIIKGYIECCFFLNALQHKIFVFLTETEGCLHIPIRLVLRDTREYLCSINSMNKQQLQSKYTPEECEQMFRGDVPYFFTTIHSSQKIYYYINSAGEKKEASSAGTASLFNYKCLLVNDGVKDLNRMSMVKNGVMKILKHFLVDQGTFNFNKNDLTLYKDGLFYFLNYKDELVLKSPV